MTPLWKKYLDDYIEPYIAKHGFAPTRREIAEMSGTSVATVAGTLYRMRDRGLIRLNSGWRNIEVCGKGARKSRQLEAA